MPVCSSRSKIRDDLKWGNTNSVLRSETSQRLLFVGLLIIIFFFTLLALTHGRSSVSRTPLLWSMLLDVWGRSQAWQLEQGREVGVKRWVWEEVLGVLPTVAMENNWHRVYDYHYTVSPCSLPHLVRSLVPLEGVGIAHQWARVTSDFCIHSYSLESL